MTKLLLTALLLTSFHFALADDVEDGVCQGNSPFCEGSSKSQCKSDPECHWHVRSCRGRSEDTAPMCMEMSKSECREWRNECVWK